MAVTISVDPLPFVLFFFSSNVYRLVMYSYGLCIYMYFHISIYRLPFICTIILVIAVAEGHKGHSTLDKAFYLGDTQVNSS